MVAGGIRKQIINFDSYCQGDLIRMLYKCRLSLVNEILCFPTTLPQTDTINHFVILANTKGEKNPY